MASFGVIRLSQKNGMTNQEKIMAAKKRIKELERLIAYWKDAK